MTRQQTSLIHEGGFAAEVDVQQIDSDDAWAPYLSAEDAEKLDRVRQALRRGDLAEALKLGRIFRLMPVTTV